MTKAESPPPHPRVIALTGFMGAGKTTVAAALAARLGCESIDLDDFITAREGRTPQQLIDTLGEEQFREAETRALAEALEGAGRETPSGAHAREGGAHPLVLALGGGAWALARNRALLEDAGALVVWLDAPFELCWRRIKGGEGSAGVSHTPRPFARDPERARRLYEHRRAFYELAALHVEVTKEKSPQLIAEETARAAALR